MASSLQSINEAHFEMTETELKPTKVTTPACMKYAAYIPTDGISLKSTPLGTFSSMNYSAAIFSHAANDSFKNDSTIALSEVRKIEKHYGTPIFTVLSMSNFGDFQSVEFQDMCKYVYTAGFDAILITKPEDRETVKFIRNTALGLRGRRVKIFAEKTTDIDIIQECDGVVITDDDDQADPLFCREIISRQKLLFGACSVADVVITPLVGEEEIRASNHMSSVTPLTTVPSSPSSSRFPSRSVSTGSTTSRKSLLFKELEKFVKPTSTRLIICLSDDGMSACELSVQSRLFRDSLSTTMPPILGLSASESVARYMGCLYGVIPLQTQSFISVGSVVKNAIEYAQSRNLVAAGDHVVVVTQPPPVTASTNESCFEGVVYDIKISIA